jgi:hypothetical protein
VSAADILDHPDHLLLQRVEHNYFSVAKVGDIEPVARGIESLVIPPTSVARQGNVVDEPVTGDGCLQRT